MPAPHPRLLGTPLLAHLDPTVREAVVAAGHGRSLERGQVLFHEGDPAEALFVVLAGRVKLFRQAPSGREMLLHLADPGQTFAEAALFAQGTYPASAQALDETRLWSLPRDRLVALVRRSPEISLALLGSMARWTRVLAAKLEERTQRRVEERVAALLVERASGTRPRTGDEIQLGDPRHLIAARIGTVPEVLSRALRRLESEGVARFGPSVATVLDPIRLEALAAGRGDL